MSLWRHYPNSLNYDFTTLIPSTMTSLLLIPFTMTSLPLLWRHYLYYDVTTSTMTSLPLLWRHYLYYDVNASTMTSLPLLWRHYPYRAWLNPLLWRHYLCYDVTNPSAMTSLPLLWRHYLYYDVTTLIELDYRWAAEAERKFLGKYGIVRQDIAESSAGLNIWLHYPHYYYLLYYAVTTLLLRRYYPFTMTLLWFSLNHSQVWIYGSALIIHTHVYI